MRYKHYIFTFSFSFIKFQKENWIESNLKIDFSFHEQSQLIKAFQLSILQIFYRWARMKSSLNNRYNVCCVIKISERNTETHSCTTIVMKVDFLFCRILCKSSENFCVTVEQFETNEMEKFSFLSTVFLASVKFS